MDFETIVKQWVMAVRGIKVPENEDDLDRLIAFSDFIIDKMADGDDPGLTALLLVVGNFIEEYESKSPYKSKNDVENVMMIGGHRAAIQYDPELDTFRGEFVGLNGGADFYGASVQELREEGELSLKAFLDMCKEKGIDPLRRNPPEGIHET